MILLISRKMIRYVLCGVLVLGMAGLGVFALAGHIETNILQASAEGNWGLSFQQDGAPPVANATADYLAKYDAFYIGDGGSLGELGNDSGNLGTDGKKYIYLTYDAGYENGNTAIILDALKKHNAPAAFFLVGNYISSSPDLVKRMVEEGHIVGNHTFSHPDMSQIGTEESFKKEIEQLEQVYKDTTGKDIEKFYRPPQGKYSEKNLEMAKALGYKTVFWSLAYVDWYESDQPTHEEAFDKLLTRIHPGAIVLLHSTSKTNAEIMDELLCKWEKMGYSFRPINELK